MCPSCQGDNTIVQGRAIISRFFRSSASAINFGGVLHKLLCNVFFPRRLFFCPLLANGSGGRFFLVAEAAVDIHMHIHERSPPLLPCCRGPAATSPNRPTVGWVGGTHRHDVHVFLKSWGKTRGTRAVCQLLHSLARPDRQYNLLCYKRSYFSFETQQRKE